MSSLRTASAALLLAARVAAAPAAPEGDADRPCWAESERYCAHMDPGAARFQECVAKLPREKLSSRCRAAVEAGGPRRRTARSAAREAADPCAAELGRFCAGVQPGEGRKIDCLKKVPSRDLSAACRADMARRIGGMWSDGRMACGQDSQRFCKDAPDRLACLRSHWARLSQACRDHLRGGLQPSKTLPSALEACGSDFIEHCGPGDVPGQCLAAKKAEVSAACRAALEKLGPGPKG